MHLIKNQISTQAAWQPINTSFKFWQQSPLSPELRMRCHTVWPWVETLVPRVPAPQHCWMGIAADRPTFADLDRLFSLWQDRDTAAAAGNGEGPLWESVSAAVANHR